MYFGTPSPQGKFYKGLSTDTPVNHDLHWRDRVVKENHMVKAQNKHKRAAVNPDMFVKRPWTDEETQQLKDAVMCHGPNNWEVVCRDRTYIEMIGNHTMEDIKTKWRTIEKARLRSRKMRVQNASSSSPTRSKLSASKGGASLNVLNQLKLKQSLQAESIKRQELADSIRRERVARLEAEKKAALQMRERRKLEEKLMQFQKMADGGGGAGRSAKLIKAGSFSMLPRAVKAPSRGVPLGAGGGGGRRPEDDVDVMMARLTSRSTAIQQSAATRLRARQVLDSVRASRRKPES